MKITRRQLTRIIEKEMLSEQRTVASLAKSDPDTVFTVIERTVSQGEETDQVTLESDAGAETFWLDKDMPGAGLAWGVRLTGEQVNDALENGNLRALEPDDGGGDEDRWADQARSAREMADAVENVSSFDGKEGVTHNIRELRTLIKKEMIILEQEDRESELREFSQGRGGNYVRKAGSKISSAAGMINEEAQIQTGKMRETLFNISEFVEKVGSSLANLGSLSEESSMVEGLPTVAELKRLHKDIQKLER